jgi:putative ABC transport system permease protein
MNLIESIKEAVGSIAANKTRTFLTVLGIMIGVGAVIAMLAIGQGAQSSITGQIESVGTNMMIIMRGNTAAEVKNPRPLTLSDAKALANPLRAPSISNVAPLILGQTEAASGPETLDVTVFGVTSGYDQVINLPLQEGSFITASDCDSRASVAVIGPEAAERLLGKSTGVVGQTIRLNGYPFRVIGVAAAKGGSQFDSPDLNFYVPLTTMQLRINQNMDAGNVSFIYVKTRDAESSAAATREATTILRETHRLSARQPNDFTVTKQEDLLSMANSITSVFTIFLSGIAAISLLVGGIGIMNIMLVSVTERTREIGLRKAMGARSWDIMLQFLTESVLLSLLGGLIGICLGWLLGKLVGFVAAQSGTVLTPVVSLGSVLLATLFSMAVGVFFGWYPASRAARLEPVEALRYE